MHFTLLVFALPLVRAASISARMAPAPGYGNEQNSPSGYDTGPPEKTWGVKGETENFGGEGLSTGQRGTEGQVEMTPPYQPPGQDTTEESACEADEDMDIMGRLGSGSDTEDSVKLEDNGGSEEGKPTKPIGTNDQDLSKEKTGSSTQNENPYLPDEVNSRSSNENTENSTPYPQDENSNHSAVGESGSSNRSGSDPEYMNTINKYLTTGLKNTQPKLEYDSTLEQGACESSKQNQDAWNLVHTGAGVGEVLAPDEGNVGFEKIFVGCWLCERPNDLKKPEECQQYKSICDTSGQTGHADAFMGIDVNYSKVGCSRCGGKVWSCQFSQGGSSLADTPSQGQGYTPSYQSVGY